MSTNTNVLTERLRVELRRRVAVRVRPALALLVACTACGTLLELLRFPERRLWILGLDAGTIAVTLGTLILVRLSPQRSVGIGIAAVNLLGLLLNVYHVAVGAPLAVCVWTLTALLCSSALFIGWGWRPQLLASVGAVVGYAVQLAGVESTTMAWITGGVYLGWVLGLSILGAEIIDRHLAAQFELVSKLTERESRLQSYFDLSLVGTAILSREQSFLEVNSELCRILGYKLEELSGATWMDLLPVEDRATDLDLFRRVLGGELPAGCREGGLLRRDGASIHASISVRALPGPLGGADHLIVVVQDMTERRRAEQEREQALVREQTARGQAEAASRAKDDFLATVSHELRTPLTAIAGWTSLLRAGGVEPDEHRHALEAIDRSGRSLNQLIDDLLDVSRIVSGKLRLSVRPVELGLILHASVDAMQVAADAKRVSLQLHLPKEPELVSGDPDRLQQVVWNLVSNAIKFTPAEGRVDVDLVREDHAAVIRVRDNGRGIDPQLLPHVFERFWQADATTTRRHGGLGLGLAIVRHLVELHGGTVAVDNADLGHGAIFTVRLPAALASPVAVEPAINSTVVHALHGIRVLLVDDEADAQEVARRALEIHGVEVRTASSTAQALAILEGWAPTVLVSDIAMPDEDGYGLIRRLRAREAANGGHVPALAFTALARAEDRKRVLAAGFDGYIAKPVDMAELVDAVVVAAANSAHALPA